MATFSIVLPVYSGPYNNEMHNRSKSVQRAIKSVINQQYPYWELIIVDDGSVDGVTPQILDRFAETDSRIKVIHKTNEARAIARNVGMEAAQNEWICWLDSDDEYTSHYLRACSRAIEEFPDYQIFNFGSLVYHSDTTTIRPVFRPAEVNGGHEWFRSGGLGAGSFIFKKSLWESDPRYRIPDEASPYHFAAASKIDLKFAADEPYIDDPQGAFSDGVYRHGLSLGNPWGDDYAQFYYLTRDNHSKALDQLLYIQYVRSTEDDFKDFGEVYDLEEILNVG